MITPPLQTLQKLFKTTGIKLFPCTPDKKPTEQGLGFQKRDFKGITEQEAQEWTKGGGLLGMPIPPGVILVDIDERETGLLVKNALERNKILPLVCQTPRGFHFYFKDSSAVRKQGQGILTTGGAVVDYRLHGKGYAIIPTESAPEREWVNTPADLVPLPEWLEPLKQAKNGEGKLLPVLEGTRDGFFFEHSGRLRSLLRDKDESYFRRVLAFTNENFTVPPLPPGEFESAIRTEGRTILPLDAPPIERKATPNHILELEMAISGDYGSANLLTDLLQGQLLWTEKGGGSELKPGSWFKWTGKAWEGISGENAGNEAQKKLSAKLLAHLKESWLETERRDIWVKKWRESARVNNIAQALTALKGFPGFTHEYENFDQATFLLNCHNGTLDLKTGELRPPDRNDHLTKILPVEYHPEASCPAWDLFLDQIMEGDSEMVQYLQTLAGYALTGNTGERCFFTLYGSGANGKSTFLETIKTLLDDYSKTVDFITLSDQGERASNNKDNALASLKGARLVIAGESKERSILDSALIKKLTGNDTITARWLYGKYFEYRPQYKIFLATNHKPDIKDLSPAIWERVKLIPFKHTVPPEKQDRELLYTLTKKRELEGILAWAVRGCLLWQRQGRLIHPAKVEVATGEYRNEMDSAGAFVKECVERDAGAEISVGEFNEKYSQWCNDSARRENKKELLRLMKDRGFEQKRKKTGLFWLGVKLK